MPLRQSGESIEFARGNAGHLPGEPQPVAERGRGLLFLAVHVTTTVAIATTVVNDAVEQNGDFGSQTKHSIRVGTTLPDRIRWVLQNKKELVKSMRHWSRGAGCAHTQVQKLLSRGQDPNAGVEVGTLAKLAAFAQVSLQWLAYGRGLPSDAGDADTSRQDVEAAILLAVSEGVDDQEFLAEYRSTFDPELRGQALLADLLVSWRRHTKTSADALRETKALPVISGTHGNDLPPVVHDPPALTNVKTNLRAGRTARSSVAPDGIHGEPARAGRRRSADVKPSTK